MSRMYVGGAGAAHVKQVDFMGLHDKVCSALSLLGEMMAFLAENGEHSDLCCDKDVMWSWM
jgi:hypothetical protein